MRTFSKLVFFAIILLPIFSSAQGNYKQGFVVTQKGDTLKGYIDLKEWAYNPQDIHFKTSLDKSTLQNYTVNDITYFELPGLVAYKKFTTSVSLDETDIQRLQDQRDTTNKIATIFLKQEQRGKNVILYSYQDNLKERFYIYDIQTGNIAELIYRIYYVPNNVNNVSTVSQNAYKQQLLLLAQKFNTYNDNLRLAIEQLEYSGPDLISVCSKINNSGKIKNTDTGKHYFGVFAGLGLNYSIINLDGIFPLYNLSKRSQSTASFKASAGFNFYPVPDVRRSVIKVELAYFSASFETIGNPYPDNSQAKSTYSFKQHTIAVTPQFQYNIYNSEALKIYADAGISFNISSYSGDSYVNPVTNETESNFGLNKHVISFPFKAGVVLNNKLDIYLTYVYPHTISNDLGGGHENFNYSFKEQLLQFGVNYLF